MRPEHVPLAVEMVPDVWEPQTLGDLERKGQVRLGRGQVISQVDINEFPGDYPIYSSSIHDDGLFGRYARYLFDEELITWSIDGGGNFFYRPKHRFSVTNVCGYMRINTTTIDYRFLAYQLQLLHEAKTYDYQMKAHPSVIRWAYTVALPRIDEQERIAAALSDVDALISSLDKLIAKKRDIKQAAMQQLLTGKRRLPGFCGEWVSRRIGDISDSSSGGTPLSSVSAYYGGSIPWVSISDMTSSGKYLVMTERSLTDEGLAASAAKVFPAGTVLYAMYASIGECSIAAIELCSSQAILGIRPRESCDGHYLYYWLVSKKDEVIAMGQHGTQANLNADMVKDFRVPLPTIDEQRAIANVLSDMDAEIEALERRRDKTRLLKQGMMQELLTGRVRLV